MRSRYDRHRLCGPRFRRLLRRLRPPASICVDKDASKIAAPQPRRDADLRARPRPSWSPTNVRAGRLQLHHRARQGRWPKPMRCSSRSARRRGAATAMPTCPMSMRPRARSPARIDGFTVVVTKSTVPVGTGDEVERIIRDAQPRRRCRGGLEPGIPARGRGDPGLQASRPHRRRHRGRAATRGDGRALPAALSRTARRSSYTGRRTAELTKYAANAFLATKITFINEIADLCEQRRRRRAGGRARHRPRQPHRHQVPACRPGLWRLVLPEGHAGADQDRRRTIEAPLRHRRDGARTSTTSASARWRARSSPRSAASLRGKTIAILGLTFKPNTDDMREAPSIPLITALHDIGARVRAYDPVGMEQAQGSAARARPIARTPTNAPRAPTPWSSSPSGSQFRALDLKRIKRDDEAVRSWSTCATSTVRTRWPRAASPTRASAGRAGAATPSRLGFILSLFRANRNGARLFDAICFRPDARLARSQAWAGAPSRTNASSSRASSSCQVGIVTPNCVFSARQIEPRIARTHGLGREIGGCDRHDGLDGHLGPARPQPIDDRSAQSRASWFRRHKPD